MSLIRLARRPFRTPIGQGRSAFRFGGSGQCVVKVEHHISFAFLNKWIYHYICFLDYICFTVILLGRRRGVAIAAITYSFLTPEKRRHTLQIGVHGRRVPGLNLIVSQVWLRIEGG
jgi:hypothetical protein